jgi:gliding motility-associated-like protein
MFKSILLNLNVCIAVAKMQPSKQKTVLIIMLLIIGLRGFAQLPGGSLGDPVINETFGAGATYGIGPALPGTVTNFKYTAEMCPQDGLYTIASSLGSCFGGTWQVVPHDHTGDKNGYMMVINSSYEPGIFYVQKASGNLLCPNTTYEFSAWIMNVMRDNSITANHIRPNITFSIETADGIVLKTYNTGNIPQGDVTNFVQYGTSFTTPSNGADIVVKMINNAPGGNGNDLILDDITFRPYGPTILAGFGDVTSTADRDLCEGESGTYILKASQAGYADPYYQWQVNKNDGKGWLDINGETTTTLNISFTNATANKNQYRMGVLNGSASAITCRIYSQPLTVNVNALPVVVVAAKTIVCETQELRLTATGGTDYHWAGPNGFTSNEQSPVVSSAADNSKDGVYTVTVTTNGCVSTASTRVSVLPKVNPTISNDVTICEGSTTQLVAGGGIQYKWIPSEGLDHDDIANPTARPLVTTTYHVRVDNGGCFDESKLVTVNVLKIPMANAGADIIMNEGETVKLNGTAAGDNVTYYWTPADNLDNPLSLTPSVTPANNITYTLHVQSQGNCGIATDEVFVRVYKKITIPNTFSPNNDGVNDLWNIDQLITYPECVLTIFTRDGRQVYRSIGYAKAWSGNYQGQTLPAGVYYYTIDLKNNTTIRSGWVMMMR